MGRVVIVTGGTRGIGEAIGLQLRDAGYKVAATYAGNTESANKFTENSGIPAFKFDVSDFDACQQGVKEIVDQLGEVDILVNNAGITRDGTMHKMDFERWDKVIQTNLSSCFKSKW